ncbi:hypothetical protein MA9V1_056 [Chryseobacterium phage MA9V-1]|nr:hypothetical protein MA9V1_056 [Chryseobacterium phage MA9V-1]
MSINTQNSLRYDKNALGKQPAIDRLSFQFGKILTSTLLIILVMVTFLVGISVHLADVFGSWYLAVGMQAVILIASTNSDILPTVKIGKGTLTVIPFVMSFFMAWYIFISFDGLKVEPWGVEFYTALSKSIGIAATEYMFSYLFTFRFNKFMGDLNGLKKAEADAKVADLADEQEFKRQIAKYSEESKPINAIAETRQAPVSIASELVAEQPMEAPASLPKIVVPEAKPVKPQQIRPTGQTNKML